VSDPSAARDRRRLAAIVSADVVGYSRLMGRDEGGTLAALKAHRRELIDPSIAEHRGRIVKTLGDGLLLEFPSVVDAVACSVEIQRGMAKRNAGVPDDRRIDFRIGINLGDIIIDEDDIFGDGVNVAARIQPLADAGGICVSRVVRDQVVDKLAFTFEDMGAHSVKNIARPVEVFRLRDLPGQIARTPSTLASSKAPWPPSLVAPGWLVAAAVIATAVVATAWILHSRSTTSLARAQPALSVAILPFTVAAGSEADQPLADRLAQDVTTALGRWRWATVAAAPRQLPAADVRKIGRDLNVRYLVDAQLRRTAGKLSITVNLVDAESATNAWSERLEFDAAGQDEASVAARRIKRLLQTSLYEAEMRRAAARPTAGSAWDLVLRGDVELFAGNDPVANAAAARAFYDQALRIDPNFVPALISITVTNNELVSNNFDLDPARFKRAIEEMDSMTARAVQLDERDSNTWFMRAGALMWLHRFNEALAANARGQALDPDNAIFVSNAAYIAFALDGPAKALALAEQAATMDRGTMSEEGMYIRMTCHAYLLLGRYTDALPACEGAAARGNWWGDHVVLAAVYFQLGDGTKAEIAKTEVLKQQPKFTIEKFKSLEPATRSDRYLVPAETHLYAALRKVGLPER
jgi:adenylate cyclase